MCKILLGVFLIDTLYCTCMGITPNQEHPIFDSDGDNRLNLLILIRIAFPENFRALNNQKQKAYYI